MIEFLSNADTEVFLFFNSMHTAYLDRFMMMFTGRFVWVPMYAALLYTILRNCPPRRALVTALCVILAIAVSDQFCGHLLRPAVARLRPANLDNPLSALAVIVNDYRGGTYGFPSCHAANSFALATFCSLFLRTRRAAIFILVWAILNSYSRLYLGVHYPGDLFVGAVFGAIFGALCYYLSRIIPPTPVYTDAQLAGPFRTSDLMMLVGCATAAFIAVYAIFPSD